MRAIALIVAGGEGTRMGSALPKQFLPIQNRPLLFITLEAFIQSKTKPEIFLVMHQDHLERWNNYCEEWNFREPHRLVPGGKTRSESVYFGLKAIEQSMGIQNFPDWIAVHDAVRPLIRPSFIDSGFEFAQKMGNSIPSISLKDSLRKVDIHGSKAVAREEYRLIQTPQIFPGRALYVAYKESINALFSDDASLFETFGNNIHLSEGDQENIKVTYPSDLVLVEYILNQRSLRLI